MAQLSEYTLTLHINLFLTELHRPFLCISTEEKLNINASQGHLQNPALTAMIQFFQTDTKPQSELDYGKFSSQE